MIAIIFKDKLYPINTDEDMTENEKILFALIIEMIKEMSKANESVSDMAIPSLD